MKLRILALLAACLLLWGCGKRPAAEPPATEPPAPTEPPIPTVAICLPGRSADWQTQATAISTALEAKGYQVQIEYGAEDVLLQQSQVQALLYRPVDCMVLGAYDPLTLSETLSETDVPVVAYDRMLRYASGIDGCVAADYFDAGQQIAQYALDQYDPETRTEPLTVELFMGQPQDPNALLFYEGVMSVLQPLLDNGTVKCLSGRLLFEDVCLIKGELEDSRDLCFDYLSLEYENTFPDILIAGSDALAEGCIQALDGMAFSPEDRWPVVTGLGGTEDGLALLEEGMLTVTAAVDTEALAAECVSWVLALLEGTPLPENSPVHNGTADVPTSLQKMQLLPGR